MAFNTVKIMKNKKYIRKTFKLGIILFLLYWFISLVHVWHLTYLYGEIFREVIANSDFHAFFGEDINRIRILEFSENFAIVYYTPTRHYIDIPISPINFNQRRFNGGELLHFEKIRGEWQIIWWDTIWSSFGNADRFIWPLIR